MSDKDTGKGSAVALAFGMLVGLVLGFLYAPRPGKETRELIRTKAKEAQKRVGEITDQAKNEAKARMEEVMKEAK